jgi:tripartite-type tricarboxylate transporter receptor subunit TctC
MIDRRRFGFAFGLAACGALPALTAVSSAQTDQFPSRPITILVPFPPGGTSDVMTRAVAQKVGDSLKTNIVIENRGGGGGVTAAIATKQAAPDGYTLFLANNGLFAITPAITPDMRFDPIKDFQPITPIVLFPSVLVVPANSPAKTVKELVDLAKTKPGGLSFGSQGVGSGGHILGEMLRLKTGVPMTHVPYRGAGPAMNDVAGGSIDLLFTSYISAAGHVQAGKARILALTAAKRSPTIPDVPTMTEAGFPGTDLEIWHGIVAPAGTPAAIVRKLNAEFVKAAHSPDLERMATPLVTDVLTGTPEEFAKLIAADIDRLGKVARDAGIKVQ